jgi:hypothetical protein
MRDALSTAASLPEMTSQALRPYLAQIAVTLAVTVLAVFGNDINSAVKRSVAKHPFPIRVGVFALLVAFGYGAATLLLSSLLARLLVIVDNRYLAVVLLTCFVLVGVLAELKGNI